MPSPRSTLGVLTATFRDPMTDAQRTFIRRFSSTAVLWTALLWTIFTGWEPGFVLLIAGLGLVGLWEYY